MRTVGRQAIRSARRARQWAITAQNFTLSAMTVAVDLQSGLEVDLDANLHNVTVSAIRTTLDLQFAAGLTIGDRTLCYFGIIWLSNDAIAAGGSSLPNPANDSADWIMHGTRLVVSESTLIHKPRGGQLNFFGDSMRKQRENNSSLVMIGATVTPSEHGVQCFVGGRVLFILP